MLKRIQTYKNQIKIKDASFPGIFEHTLEFNAPVHGTWNIVHIGMSVPDSMQIYICADNCMRGVVMTAAEMGMMDRFACITMEERDLYVEHIKEVYEKICFIIDHKENVPSIIFIFPVCLHKFLSMDTDYLYKRLKETYPHISFVEAWMDPMCQKEGITPEQRLRQVMYDPIQKRDKDQSMNILGSDNEMIHSDLLDICHKHHINVRQLKDYKDLGSSQCNICIYPIAQMGITHLSKRLDQDYFYMPMTFNYKKIEVYRHQLYDYLNIDYENYDTNIIEKRYKDLLEIFKDTPITIDYTAHPALLSVTLFLLEHGFNVTKIYTDSFNSDEIEEYHLLQEHYPELEIEATIHASMRITDRNHEEVLAIGQKAAWFNNTKHFVNIIEGHGLWGYEGIMEFSYLLEESYYHEKDTRHIVPLKGLGCECVL